MSPTKQICKCKLFVHEHFWVGFNTHRLFALLWLCSSVSVMIQFKSVTLLLWLFIRNHIPTAVNKRPVFKNQQRLHTFKHSKQTQYLFCLVALSHSVFYYTHTHAHTMLLLGVCLCVCVCVMEKQRLRRYSMCVRRPHRYPMQKLGQMPNERRTPTYTHMLTRMHTHTHTFREPWDSKQQHVSLKPGGV